MKEMLISLLESLLCLFGLCVMASCVFSNGYFEDVRFALCALYDQKLP
jgi:hypothetical protein